MQREELIKRIDALPPLRDVLKECGIVPNKALGQNFIFDMNITDRIVRAAGNLSDKTVIEIGPGPGGLTRSILKAFPKKLITIEKDRTCLQVQHTLAEVSEGLLIPIEADALKVEESEIATPPFVVIANLPYNISTVLLVKWLESLQHFEKFTLMFQKEVVDRLSAAPSSKDYGRLSVMTQWLCDVQPQFDVPPSVFMPPPKVMSAIVNIIPRPKPLYPASYHHLSLVVRTAFNERRKMLRGSLKTLIPDCEKTLESLGITPTLRAENLTIEQFCVIARYLEEQAILPPS